MNSLATVYQHKTKTLLLVIIYALHSLSFTYLTISSAPNSNPGNKISHQKEKKKKPYSAFIVNHLPSKINQATLNIETPTPVYHYTPQSQQALSIPPQGVIMSDQRFSTDFNKRYRLLKILLV